MTLRSRQLDNYATSLLQYVETVLPTAVVAARLATDTADDNPFAEVQADLTTFFDANPVFQLGTVPLEVYLSEDRDRKLDGVDDPEALLVQIKNLDRLSRITPRYPEMRALLADDLHSAFAIVNLGERRFVERYAEPLGGGDKALDTFRKAEQVHGAAFNVYLKYGAGFNSPSPYVIAGEETDDTVSAGNGDAFGSHVAAYGPKTSVPAPTKAQWTSLFGSIDLCDCGHCKSLYSPAAYFVDVLRFLNGRKAPSYPLVNGTTSLPTPLDVLLGRRPDLQHIELTCENSTTPLPYVDLVNEILEAAVVPRTFEVPERAGSAAVLTDLRNESRPGRIRHSVHFGGISHLRPRRRSA